MSTINYAGPIAVMVDGTKGSLTNRAECAKEHFKNNLKANANYALLGATAGAAIAFPKHTNKIAAKAGTTFGNVLSKMGTKIANSKITQSIIKNPTKAGKLAFLAVGLGYLMNTIQQHAFKAGQIDQKYTDTAALESHSKKIILV